MTPRETIIHGQETLAQLRRTILSIGRRAIALLVEDASDDIALTERVFRSFDVKLDVAISVEQGVRRMREKDYDVVFLDLALPDGSGLDVISQAVAHQDDAFFIVLTGVNDENPMLKEALDRGAKCVIRKPITADHLRLIFGSVP